MTPPAEADPAAGAATFVDVVRRRAEAHPDRHALTFLLDGDNDEARLTYGELDRRARSLAARLRPLVADATAGGDGPPRALILEPPGLGFVSAFLGCLYAGVAAIPAPPPRRGRPTARLRAIVADARPALILTAPSLLGEAERWPREAPEFRGLPVFALDGDAATADEGPIAPPGPDDLAFLQYTSGSTAEPKGVMVTHRNLLHNSRLIHDRFGAFEDGHGVCWLPSFHDMGLIGGLLQPIYCGGHSTMMAPAAFLQRPLRWLQAISETGAAISGGPNFAYDLCASKITDDQKGGLDLSRWRVAFNGAEPIRAETLDRFAAAFARCGFRREAFMPCYGMAETTLLVTASPIEAPPVVFVAKPAELEQRRAVADDGPDGRPLVGSGRVADDLRVAIVDPDTAEALPDGAIGEIWVAGPSVARGYWNRPEETERTFGARLKDGDGPFLRTGDLGFLRDGELFVAGRLKDLIIIHGRNIYPQDVEWTAEQSHPAAIPEGAAAFAVEIDGCERLVVVQEVERQADAAVLDAVVAAIRRAVAEEHGLEIHAVVLIRALSLPKTSSGKVRRRACRDAYLAGELTVLTRSVLAPPEPEGPAADAGPRRTAEEIRAWLSTRLAATLGVAASAIDPRRPFVAFGLGSLQAVRISGELEEWLGRSLDPTLLYDYPTIETLARHLAGEPAPMLAPRAAPEPSRDEPIAVVGIGCRFPGADGPEGFWRLLSHGVDAVGTPPPDRPPGRRGAASRLGGYLEGVDRFDAEFFGVTPREAVRTDPQQRLLMEVAWEALEDAGQSPDRLAGTAVGVFVGISTHDYSRMLWDRPEGLDAYSLMGNAASVAANRLSYLFDFRGPSLAVDTACSSSLVAVHLACQAIRGGDASMAIAGGVNLMLAPELSDNFERGGFLAADGRCKAFDAGADGYVRGEGAGVVVLKPLGRAIADGDPIVAVIRGSAINQDGHSNGLTAPNRPAQEAVLRAAYTRAGVAPTDVPYVEAHGTGTLLGDPIEARALGAVLGEGRPADRPCRLGSVKTNIGHLEAAAGVAGLIKAALALKHRELPPSLHYGAPNPHIPFAELGLDVVTGRTPWPEGARPLAGVSSFGFGGTNAHLVLEGFTSEPVPASPAIDGPVLLPLSAKTEAALDAYATAVRSLLVGDDAPGLLDVAHTAGRRRAHHDERLAIVAADAAGAVAALDAHRSATPYPGLSTGRRPVGGAPRVAFVFTGQGGQWPGMARDLLGREPAFRQALDRCDAAFKPLAGWSIRHELTAEAPRLGSTEVAQPVLCALQIALAALYRSWGVVPDAVVGHSLGEVAAACVAGAIGVEDAMRIAFHRGRLMKAVEGRGKTAALGIDADEARKRIAPFGDRVEIAAINGPGATTIAGDPDAVLAVVGLVEAAGESARLLDVNCAFHSRQMESARADLERELAFLRPGPAASAFVSTVDGDAIEGRSLDAAYWGRNVREAVRFADAIEAAVEEGCDAFVELGPHPALVGSIQRIVRRRRPEAVALATLRRGGEGRATLLEALGGLYAAGVAVDWAAVNPAGRHVRLPSYPWQRERFWPAIEAEADAEPTPAAATSLDLVSTAEGNGHPAPHYAGNGDGNGHAEPAAGNGTPVEQPADAAKAETDWRSLPPEGRRDWLIGFLRERIAVAIEQEPARIDPDRPLHAIGLDSLTATEVKWAIEDELETNLPMSTLIDGPSIATLADRALELVYGPATLGPEAEPEPEPAPAPGPAPAPEPTAEVPDEVTTTHPVSAPQRRLWVIHQLEPTNPAYNITAAIRLEGVLNEAALRRALDEVVRRHETLRTTFAEVDGQPVQVVHEARSLPIATIDLRDLPEPRREPEIARRLREEAARPFDIDRGPLVRVVMLKLSDREHVVLLNLHHIVADGLSIGVLLRELAALYYPFSRGLPSPLPEPPHQYADFARWQLEWLKGDDRQAQLDYWRTQLAGLEPLELPTDRPRPAAPSHRGGSRWLTLPAEVGERVRALGRSEGATPFMTLLAGFHLLMHRYSGAEDVAVGTPIGGRVRAEDRDLIGLFVNSLVLRVDLGGRPSFRELLRRVRRVAADAYAHQDVPFERVVAVAEPGRDTGRSPLFQVMFVYLEDPLREIKAPGFSLIPLDIDSAAAKFDLTLFVSDTGRELRLKLEYDTDLYEPATIDRMLTHYRLLVEAALAEPDATAAALPMLADDERRRLLDAWNATQAEAPAGPLAHRRFEAQAKRTPDAVALTAGGDALTYRQLNERANRLAHRLRALGVGPDVLVGLCVERSAAMVVGILGVLKAGGAYVPIDPAYPDGRIADMLADSGVPVLLTTGPIADRLPEHAARVARLDDEATFDAMPADDPAVAVGPDHLAYVIYTSGSTGKPKGAMIAHGGLANYLDWCAQAYPVAEGQGAPVHSSISFDLTVTSVFPPLMAGRRVDLLGEGFGVEALAEALRSRGDYGLVKLTPAHLQLLAQELEPHEAAGRTRAFVVGGEQLTDEAVRYWSEHAPATKIINEYGPTETVVGCCTFTVPPSERADGAVPIGRPIINTRLYVLDPMMQPTPVGVPGELYVGGAGVARGYLNRPALTADRFVPDPFGPEPGGRLYRTGDRCRWRADGILEFLGRNDDQVKIRGYRIEPGEVEAALAGLPGVREAAVVVREDAPGERRLIGYAAGASLDAAALKRDLGRRLPEYMVPSAIVTLDALPLTPNGKVDRRSLPAPEVERSEPGTLDAPRNPAEESLAKLAATVLHVEAVGIHDDLFERGIDSILAIQLIARARQSGLKLAPAEVFRHRTIAELAAIAERVEVVVAEQGPVVGPLPLTPIQRWFFERDLAAPDHDNQSLMLAVDPAPDPAHLADALAALIRHHDALRLRFTRAADGWHQEIAPPDDAPPPFESFDLSATPEADRPARIEAEATRLEASFDLGRGPLLRVALFRMGEGRPARLLLIAHHLIVDGVSWRVLLEDLASTVARLEKGEPPALPPKTTSIRQWAEALEAFAAAPESGPEYAYWFEAARAQASPLPVDGDGRDPGTAGESVELISELDADETAALLREVPSAFNSQINDALLAALAEALAGWTGRDSSLIDLEGHGREEITDGVDLSRTVGWFTTIFPVRLRRDPSGDPSATLRGVKERLRAVPRRGLGYGVLRYLGDPATAAALSAAPRAEVLFNYFGQLDRIVPEGLGVALAADPVGPPRAPDNRRSHPLELNAAVSDGRLHARWTYNPAVHRPETIERLAAAFLDALRALVDQARDPGAVGYSPSDFPLAGLDQQALDRLIGDQRDVEDVYPLSPMQEGMLFHAAYAPEAGDYVQQWTCTLRGTLDRAAFRESWRQVVDRHAILRTSFHWADTDRPVQIVHRRVGLPLEEHDWRGLSAEELESKFEDFLTVDRRKGFVPAWAPLVRLALIRTADDAERLVLTFHHLILDGWGMPILFLEALNLYEAALRGEPAALPDRRPYRDYIAWLVRQDHEAAESYWRAHLDGVRAATPLGIDRPAAPAGDGPPPPRGERILRLPAETTAALRRTARACGLTLNTILEGTYAVLLSRYSGQDDVVFGVTVSGRPAELPGVEEMVGLFINALPARVRVDESAALVPWLAALQARQVEGRRYEYTPLVAIQGWSAVPRGRPLFESLVVFENFPIDAALEGAAAGLGVEAGRMREQTNHALTLMVSPGDSLVLRADFDARRLDVDAVDRLLGHLRTLLEAVAADPGRRLADLPMIDESERDRLLALAGGGPSNEERDGPDDLDDLEGLSDDELDALINRLVRE